MRTATTVALGAVRLTGVTQVLLGLLFWSGRALQLIPLHMAVGLTFVLALWVLAGLAARARVGRNLVVFAFAWGAIVLTLGATQTRLLPGPGHWIIQVIHLLVGIVAMALAAVLTRLGPEL